MPTDFFNSPINLYLPLTPTYKPQKGDEPIYSEFQTVFNAIRNLQVAIAAGTGTSVAWGSITGLLSAQADLVAALALKIGEAPLDGQQYARQSGAWSVVTGGGGGDIIVSCDGLVNSTADPEAYEDFFVDGGNAMGAP